MHLIKQISFPSSMNDLPPGSVAVVANFYAGPFGGTLSQLLKCLTAVKVCEEYKNKGIIAVPVCLVRPDMGARASSPAFEDKCGQNARVPGKDGFPVNTQEGFAGTCFIDRNYKLHCLKSAGFETVERIFPDGDREALFALKEAFASDTNIISSCAQWLKYLLDEYGVTVVEYDTFVMGENSDDSGHQSQTLPVSTFVVDAAEITEYDKMPLGKDNVSQPLIRLCPDVTISNARTMKTLKRYGLNFARLFDGKERVMDYVRETLKSDVPGRLQILRDETAAVLDGMENVVFATRGDRSSWIRKARAARIIYQLEKMQRHSNAALAAKEKAAENRIGKACDFLAPLGQRQQDVLGGAQITVYYGLAGLRALYEHLDISTPDRQLIELD